MIDLTGVAQLRLHYAVELGFSGPFCGSSSFVFATSFALFSTSFFASSGFLHTPFLTWMGWFAMRAGRGSLRHGQWSAPRSPERKTGQKLEVSSQVHHGRSFWWILSIQLVAHQFDLGLPPWLRQTVKTCFTVRCKNLDRQDHFIAC